MASQTGNSGTLRLSGHEAERVAGTLIAKGGAWRALGVTLRSRSRRGTRPTDTPPLHRGERRLILSLLKQERS